MQSSIADTFIFNTLTRQTEQFSPLVAGKVSMYCCGPTVYNFQHVGNLRTYIFEDALARMFRYAGYSVTHVMNITDVGHLVSDADDGEDKMLVASRREGRSSHEIAAHYTKIFFDDCEALNIKRPDTVCKATEHVSQMIALIERLISRGHAYVAGGNVYFNVATFPAYGELARLDLQNLEAGARIDVDPHKKNPFDFALWFTKSKFEGQELQWDSPWGRGYPGWHIECSAMSIHYLGESFDIHCGGIDHIPVHHTNEIAQSEGATGKPFARYWVHGGFLVENAKKIAKSAGEFLTLDAIRSRGYDPIAYRLFCLGSVYRNELSWSWEGMESAAGTLRKLKNSVRLLRETGAEAHTPADARAGAYRERFRTALFNDLGTSKALAVAYEMLDDGSLAESDRLWLLEDFDLVLGLGVAAWSKDELPIPEDVLQMARERDDARKGKDWARADALRNTLQAEGYIVEDSASGTKVRRA